MTHGSIHTIVTSSLQYPIQSARHIPLLVPTMGIRAYLRPTALCGAAGAWDELSTPPVPEVGELFGVMPEEVERYQWMREEEKEV
ncbi:hypothetical protein D9613_009051 [Agrocybe pediades]|uniref:Uncharacterized protein n=1 Tax=Agrocybe pediades TaxID=84607 RepID=A0A8H4R3W2_9AGAR|nr:hypothetical protein D9613_009051 [Agrocybe pediades]